MISPIGAIDRQIDATDRQIDQLVYELYGLTEEKIRIVEGGTAFGGTGNGGRLRRRWARSQVERRAASACPFEGCGQTA